MPSTTNAEEVCTFAEIIAAEQEYIDKVWYARNSSVREGGVLHRSPGRRRTLLSEPYTRQLVRKRRKLRFHLDRQAVRLIYWSSLRTAGSRC
jgi:hypothetical protein